MECATCHVILDQPIYEKLDEPGEREQDMLELAFTLTETSRLGCQVRVSPEMHGTVIHLPDWRHRAKVRMTLDQKRPQPSGEYNGPGTPAVASRLHLQVDDSHLHSRPSIFDRKNGVDPHTIAAIEAQRAVMDEKKAKAEKAKSKQEKVAKDAEDDNEAKEAIKEELRALIVPTGKHATAFNDVVGLADVKEVLEWSLLLPMGNPTLFSGVRGGGNGVLVWGPPGCGKTMIAKATAHEVGDRVTFFHVPAGALMSKFYGESQQRVQAMAELAREHAPAIVFFDEADSLLSSRTSGRSMEHHKSLTNAILAWMDGFDSVVQDTRSPTDLVFFLAATNNPDAMDEAALRRFETVVEVPLPRLDQRLDMLKSIISKGNASGHRTRVAEEDFQAVAEATDGWSGDDITKLVRAAFLEPLKSLSRDQLKSMTPEQAPEVTGEHLTAVLQRRRSGKGLSKHLKSRRQEMET